MAKPVIVSTIGTRSPAIDSGLSNRDAVEAMLRHLRQEVEQVLPDRPDLIMLPEYCDVPAAYSEQRKLEYYSVRGERVRNMLAEIAAEHRCYIAYAAMREDADGSRRDSLQFIGRNGELVGRYDKNHPTILEMAEYGVKRGEEAPVFELDFGRVGGVICFDLNFDRLRLHYARLKPDLLVFSSEYHGGLMQRYWAYSCRAHFVSAVVDSPSSIISPVGETVDGNTNYFNYATARINLDCAVVHLDYNRGKLNAMKRKYGDKATFKDPGYLGSVLVASESEAFTVHDLIREFELETLDDYLARSAAHQGR